MSVLVRAERLTKRYGSLVAVDGLSLEVARGEIVALVGPNGAGKTTALKLMSGLLLPDAGRVQIAGYDLQLQPLDAKRRLGFIPDQPFLYEQLSVEEFLGFLGGVYELGSERLRERASALLSLFGLEDSRHQRISALSYGMRSRLVLIASLLHEPEALLMDEPFFGLDPSTLRLVKRLLAERAAAGLAVVLSTHQLAIVQDLAHRIAVMASGRIVALGSLAALSAQHGGGELEDVFFRLTA